MSTLCCINFTSCCYIVHDILLLVVMCVWGGGGGGGFQAASPPPPPPHVWCGTMTGLLLELTETYWLICPRESVCLLQLLMVAGGPCLERREHQADGQLGQKVLDHLVDDKHDSHSHTNLTITLQGNIKICVHVYTYYLIFYSTSFKVMHYLTIKTYDR